MSIDEIEKMPIEKIIRLPNFKSLTSEGGIENSFPGEPIRNPYWEIRFKAIPTGKGTYMCFEKEIPRNTFLIYKFK